MTSQPPTRQSNAQPGYTSGPKSGLTAGPQPQSHNRWPLLALLALLLIGAGIAFFLLRPQEKTAPVKEYAWTGTTDQGYEVHFASYEDAEYVPHVILVVRNSSGEGVDCVGCWINQSRFTENHGSEELRRRCYITDAEAASFVSYDQLAVNPSENTMTWDLFSYGQVELRACRFSDVLTAAKNAGVDVDARRAVKEAGVVDYRNDLTTWDAIWAGKNQDAGKYAYLALSPDLSQGIVGFYDPTKNQWDGYCSGAYFRGVNPGTGSNALLVLNAAKADNERGFEYTAYRYCDYNYSKADNVVSSITYVTADEEKVSFSLAPYSIKSFITDLNAFSAPIAQTYTSPSASSTSEDKLA